MTPPAHRCRAVSGDGGVVSAAHPAAVAAGVEMLRAGGTAVDAAIAAQAVVCTLMPQSAGLGGDMLALVRAPDGLVTAVNGTGRSSRAGFARRAGGVVAPGSAGAPPGGDVTVPGLVDSWVVSHNRWARLPLAKLLSPAVRAARDGSPLGASLAAAREFQRGRLVDGGGADWPLFAARAGEVWRQPELADLLEAVGRDGSPAFYRGAAARAVAAAARRAGGLLDAGDMAAHDSVLGEPVTVAWHGGSASVQPPMSQGVLLALALQALDGGSVAWHPDRADHLLVELTEAAFEWRSQCGRGAGLLTEALKVDMEAAARRGGPRAYLHTAAVAVADADGMVVSSLVSVFDDFGSAVFVPELGLVLNNRAAGFTDGANAPAADARPVHTLAPMLLEDGTGDIVALATPGADGQIQTLLQVLCSRRYGHTPLTAALAAPRWRTEGARLMVEDGHPAAEALSARGHDVVTCPPGQDRFGAVAGAGLTRGRPFAVADWRRAMEVGVA